MGQFSSHSVCGEGLERRQCHCLASGGLPGIRPISSYLTHSLYATGTLPAVALVLNPSVGGFVYVLRLCRLFKQSFLKIWQVFPPPQSPPVFTARGNGDLSTQCWNPGPYSLAWGWDHWLPRYTSQFLSTTENVGCLCSCHHHLSMPHCISSPLHVSHPPTCFSECGFFKFFVVVLHTVRFSDSSGCYLLRFSCNSFCGCVQRWSVSTSASILTGSPH